VAAAHRIPVTEDDNDIGPYSYATSFQVTGIGQSGRSPERWARAAFEEAPQAMRWFVLCGWVHVLRFRLGSRQSSAHVLGWRIVSDSTDRMVLEVHSPLATAKKVVRVEPSSVTMTTFVHYERPLGRAIWASVMPVHHRTEPYLLGHAASHSL
jgi:hypothetical protein